MCVCVRFVCNYISNWITNSYCCLRCAAWMTGRRRAEFQISKCTMFSGTIGNERHSWCIRTHETMKNCLSMNATQISLKHFNSLVSIRNCSFWAHFHFVEFTSFCWIKTIFVHCADTFEIVSLVTGADRGICYCYLCDGHKYIIVAVGGGGGGSDGIDNKFISVVTSLMNSSASIYN